MSSNCDKRAGLRVNGLGNDPFVISANLGGINIIASAVSIAFILECHHEFMCNFFVFLVTKRNGGLEVGF